MSSSVIVISSLTNIVVILVVCLKIFFIQLIRYIKTRIKLQLYRSGTAPQKTDIVEFSPLAHGGSCHIGLKPNCTAISVSELPWYLHGDQLYYVTIKVSNTIGLYVLAVSDAYVHTVQKASKGVVHDISEIPSIKQVCFQAFFLFSHQFCWLFVPVFF